VSGRRNHHLDGQLLSFRKLEVPRIVGWDTTDTGTHTTHSQQSDRNLFPRERINGLATSWDTALGLVLVRSNSLWETLE